MLDWLVICYTVAIRNLLVAIPSNFPQKVIRRVIHCELLLQVFYSGLAGKVGGGYKIEKTS